MGVKNGALYMPGASEGRRPAPGGPRGALRAPYGEAGSAMKMVIHDKQCRRASKWRAKAKTVTGMRSGLIDGR